MKHKIAQKREDAVAKEVLQSVASTNMSKKEKDERILWKKNVVSDYEATTYSIFYNNAIFYTLVILASFYLFRTFSPSFNYLFSVVGSGAIIALLSTGSKWWKAYKISISKIKQKNKTSQKLTHIYPIIYMIEWLKFLLF